MTRTAGRKQAKLEARQYQPVDPIITVVSPDGTKTRPFEKLGTEKTWCPRPVDNIHIVRVDDVFTALSHNTTQSYSRPVLVQTVSFNHVVAETGLDPLVLADVISSGLIKVSGMGYIEDDKNINLLVEWVNAEMPTTFFMWGRGRR